MSHSLREYPQLPELPFKILIYLRVWQVLYRCGWNRTRTALELGINQKHLFYYIKKMKSLGYNIPDNPLISRSSP